MSNVLKKYGFEEVDENPLRKLVNKDINSNECDFYNGNVYSRKYTRPTYKNTTNPMKELMNNKNISSVRLVDGENVCIFNKKSNNALQYFYFNNKKIGYNEICRVEERSSEGFLNYVNQGYNNFYNLYKKNEYGIEKLLCTCIFVENE